MPFVLKSNYRPCGDQPQAIEALVRGLNDGTKDQVLLGITGSGKTFTVASVIDETQRPTLVIAHNTTLAAQLYKCRPLRLVDDARHRESLAAAGDAEQH